MRVLIVVLSLALAGLSLSACSTMSGGTHLERRVVMSRSLEIAQQYASAWNDKNWAAFGALHLPDARHVNLSGDFLRGRSEIVEAYRRNRDLYPSGARMSMRLEGARAISNDAVVAVVIQEILTDPAQASSARRSRLTLTIVKRNADWLIAQAQASAAN